MIMSGLNLPYSLFRYFLFLFLSVIYIISLSSLHPALESKADEPCANKCASSTAHPPRGSDARYLNRLVDRLALLVEESVDQVTTVNQHLLDPVFESNLLAPPVKRKENE
jgi:hypothetical protein